MISGDRERVGVIGRLPARRRRSLTARLAPAVRRVPPPPFEPPPPLGRAARRSGRRSSRRSSSSPPLRALGQPLLQRLLDVVARARVGLDVGRQVLQRVAVAVDRVRAVDPAVVPVVDQRLPAGRRALRRRGTDAEGRHGCEDDNGQQQDLDDVPGRMDHEKRWTAPMWAAVGGSRSGHSTCGHGNWRLKSECRAWT